MAARIDSIIISELAATDQRYRYVVFGMMVCACKLKQEQKRLQRKSYFIPLYVVSFVIFNLSYILKKLILDSWHVISLQLILTKEDGRHRV
jgi:hypothetical protein